MRRNEGAGKAVSFLFGRSLLSGPGAGPQGAPVVATNYSYGFEALANPEILDQFDSLVADEAHDLSSILTAAATLPLELGRLKDSLIECLQGEYQALWEAAQPIRTGSCCLLRCRRCWPSRDWPG